MGRSAASREKFKGGSVLFTRRITIDTVDKVQNLVGAATAAPFEVNVIDERFTVNAKSIMGLFSINRSEPVTIAVSADDNSREARAFLDVIDEYIV